MSDWAAFIESVPWFLNRDAAVEFSPPRTRDALSPSVASLFPQLERLLSESQITDVVVNGLRYELLAWDSPNGDRLGWLCLPPSKGVPRNLHVDHKKLLESFGGIVERFNEPEDTWLLNMNDALTEREAAHDGRFIRDYEWAFDDAGLVLPIDPTEYYSIAREANGNATLCHRISGQVLMFAPDHSFDHLTELEGCPEYTLYTVNGAPKFGDWVNAVALQWLAHVERSA